MFVIVQVHIDIIICDIGNIFVDVRKQMGEVEVIKCYRSGGFPSLRAGFEVHTEIMQAVSVDDLQ